MDRKKYYRVAAVTPQVNVADCDGNARAIIDAVEQLARQGVEMAVFPEMCITGYTCGDLFHNEQLLDGAMKALLYIAESTARHGMLLWLGMPVKGEGKLFNMAVAVAGGKVLAFVPKTYIPSYNEFYEKRWWCTGDRCHGTLDPGYGLGDVPTGIGLLIEVGDKVTVSAEICEDLWAPIPPSTRAAMSGAHVLVNLSASDDLVGKYRYLKNLVVNQSARCLGAYVYASAGYGESTTDLVFDGKCLIAENGALLAEGRRWQRGLQYVMADIDLWAIKRDRMHINTFADCTELTSMPGSGSVSIPEAGYDPEVYGELMHRYSATPFVPTAAEAIDECADEIVNIQTAGLARRLDATHTRTAVIGISGGLDSTLALLVAVNAFDSLGLDRKGIIGVTMPGFGTTGRTHSNAVTLMESLGVTMREISIVPAVNQHFSDIGHDPSVHDVTYENAQARERTQLLMDIANQAGGMVVGTGDLSELALGWATYNGDQMSMYGVNAGVPKTLVKYLVRWFAGRQADPACREALLDVIDTPISPELIPADDKGRITQKTEDLVGPYELHDFFLYHTLRFGRSPLDIYNIACRAFDGMYDADTIARWLKTFVRRFFSQQFKRSCMPDGPKVGSVCLSPRGDWRMPSDASSAMWLSQLDQIGK